jgi:hypothetical protein
MHFFLDSDKLVSVICFNELLSKCILVTIYVFGIERLNSFHRKFTYILYADDLVLFADSPQSKLDSLHQYCVKWKLNINSIKSKMVSFQVVVFRLSVNFGSV